MKKSLEVGTAMELVGYGLVVGTIWGMVEAGRRRSRNRKWMGEVGESAFLHKAMELGLMVAKPWGDSSRYDFVVDSGERLLRVQVKSTGCVCKGRYAVAAHGSDRMTGYGPEEIDFLVALVVPEEVWYVIPVQAFAPRRQLWLYPRGEHDGQYEEYREAWNYWGWRKGQSSPGVTETVRARGWGARERAVCAGPGVAGCRVGVVRRREG
jgi:hypothetical protein